MWLNSPPDLGATLLSLLCFWYWALYQNKQTNKKYVYIKRNKYFEQLRRCICLANCGSRLDSETDAPPPCCRSPTAPSRAIRMPPPSTAEREAHLACVQLTSTQRARRRRPARHRPPPPSRRAALRMARPQYRRRAATRGALVDPTAAACSRPIPSPARPAAGSPPEGTMLARHGGVLPRSKRRYCRRRWRRRRRRRQSAAAAERRRRARVQPRRAERGDLVREAEL